MRVCHTGLQQKAKLKIASSAWEVRLVEISAGGFAVLATDPMEKVHPGQVGELQTTDGKFEVRVANLSDVPTHGSTSAQHGPAAAWDSRNCAN